jgi:hypothetical protein
VTRQVINIDKTVFARISAREETMSDYTARIPIAVQRRLLLALCGWRWDGRTWHDGARMALDEEVIDNMSDEYFEAFMAQWLATSAPESAH